MKKKNQWIFIALTAFLSSVLLNPVGELVEDNVNLDPYWITPITATVTALLVYFVIRILQGKD